MNRSHLDAKKASARYEEREALHHLFDSILVTEYLTVRSQLHVEARQDTKGKAVPEEERATSLAMLKQKERELIHQLGSATFRFVDELVYTRMFHRAGTKSEVRYIWW